MDYCHFPLYVDENKTKPGFDIVEQAPRGGGGGVTRHVTGYAPLCQCLKKRRRGVFFVVDVFLKHKS